MSQISRTIPPEILYETCGVVVAEYLDRLLLGDLKCSPPTRTFELFDLDDNNDIVALERICKDVTPPVHNPTVALMQSSVKIRHAVLIALSDALGIEVEHKSSRIGRLKEMPWTHIHPVRLRLWRARHTPLENYTPAFSDHKVQSPSCLLRVYECFASYIELSRFYWRRVLLPMEISTWNSVLARLGSDTPADAVVTALARPCTADAQRALAQLKAIDEGPRLEGTP
ncbi:uncharacterized protein PHACADRAFT_192708 [Phanerochaete carnosa HHB-10118-sp]|uniref:Uncharacterized protein n=1 Tax=Phanerochaete carnosa (strain HHB-10118-sp) TaxID=650164 RepID=K5V4L1_PHACS|nr:uncharacterized protein PHACADRAFT_192708 [Phanerochaete carnosa HHB-10118-sp]EKM57561.1 hypothetical protein PHACADRAFT_192708 [Phanerochaete carnosa HHB-10118-sp]